MQRKKWFIGLVGLAVIATIVSSGLVLAQGEALSPIEQLGEFLYFDEDLSEPSGQSCASCHDPGFGFADPDRGLPVSEGVISSLLDNTLSQAHNNNNTSSRIRGADGRETRDKGR